MRAVWFGLIVLQLGVLSIMAAGPSDAARSGGIDETGPYTVVPNWFKPIHDGRIQCVSGVAAESSNRIYLTTEVEVSASDPPGGCTSERSKPNAHSPTNNAKRCRLKAATAVPAIPNTSKGSSSLLSQKT